MKNVLLEDSKNISSIKILSHSTEPVYLKENKKKKPQPYIT